MLRKAGHLAGVVSVAVGQFTDIQPIQGVSIADLLREHFDRLNVPVLGRLPLGHGSAPLSTLLGVTAMLDATTQVLSVETRVTP